MSKSEFQFNISLSVLNHLGRNLYRNFITVLGEAISNSWDADAKNVWIDFDKDNSVFSIKDDGEGMTDEDFQGKFLKIGYSKRKDGAIRTKRNRPFIGAKGIGKLALLSCADRVSIFTRTKTTDYVGGVIDNSGLDQAIKDDLVPEQYPLEALDFNLVSKKRDGHDQGTILVFEGTKEVIRNSVGHIKKLLAMSFKFSLLDQEFNLLVNGQRVTIDDLNDLIVSTQFVWFINGFSDDYTRRLEEHVREQLKIGTKLNVKGFIATVKKPRNLSIAGTEERATIDLFVNGRIREKNIIRNIPTNRIVENYIYGQIHFDLMDQGGIDPFTSSREGVKSDDENFQSLLDFLKRELLPKVIDEWDDLRLKHGDAGDEENKRKTRKQRHAIGLYSSASEEFQPKSDAPGKEQVEGWLRDLQPDAEFNIPAYVDCFLAENLVRRYINESGIEITDPSKKEIAVWRKRESDRKGEAGISFDIREKDDDLSYLDLNFLAHCAEENKSPNNKPSLHRDATNYRPVRNAVGHTGLLTDAAKSHLNLTFQNIKARIVDIISGKKT